MVTVKVLKRKDASSVLVAIVLALMASTFLSSISVELANKISGVDEGLYASASAGWEAVYLQPTVYFLVQLVALELLIWVFVYLSSISGSKK